MPEATAKQDLRIEYMAVGEIKKFDKNPKLHATEDIAKSIRRFGYVDPLIIDEKSKVLVAGHGRCEALDLMRLQKQKPPENVKVGKNGEWLVPVVRGVKFNSANEVKAYVVATNRTTEKGGWDEEALLAILDDVSKLKVGLDGTGFSEDEHEKLRLLVDGEETPVREEEEKKPTKKVTMTTTHTCPKCGHEWEG